MFGTHLQCLHKQQSNTCCHCQSSLLRSFTDILFFFPFFVSNFNTGPVSVNNSSTMFLYFLLSVVSAYNGAPASFDSLARDEALCLESCKSPSRRTLFGVVWSCLSTTILCAWTAVHPNVPPRSKWQARWNRLKLMFWMVVAPELVLAWAVRQFFAAKHIRDTYNERKGVWFVLMDGR